MTVVGSGLDVVAVRGGATALGPWLGEHLVRVFLANAAGLASVIASWYLASGSTTTSDALGWLGLAAAGVAVAGVANGLWLGVARQSITLARVAMLATVAVPNGVRPVQAAARATHLVAGSAMTRYHRPDCGLVANKATSAASRSRHEAAGRSPCRVCEP